MDERNWTQEAQAWLDSASLEQPEVSKLWHLMGAVQRLIWRLESQLPQEAPQASEESSPTTASPTTGSQWAVLGQDSILRATLQLWLSGRATTESLVARLFECAVQRDALPADEQILALAAAARTSTSANLVSRSSAAPESSATSRGGSSEPSTEEPTRGASGHAKHRDTGSEEGKG